MAFRRSLYSIFAAEFLLTEHCFDEANYANETALDRSHALAAHSGAGDYLAGRIADGIQYLESPPYSTRQGHRSRHPARLHFRAKNCGKEDLAQSQRPVDSGPQTVSLCR